MSSEVGGTGLEARDDVRRWVITPLVFAVGLLWAVPTVWLIAGSLRPSNEIFTTLDPVTWQTFLPIENFKPENYTNVLSTKFGRALVNSLVISIGGAASGLFVASLAAFALAAMPIRRSRLVLGIVVVSFLVPTEAISFPLFSLFTAWSLENTYHGVILPSIADGFAIFLLYQFFLGIPRSLRDAAMVDGASWLRIYRSVYVPLSVPALISAAIIIFLFHWQAYLWPLLIVAQQDMIVGQVALAQLFGQFETDYGMVFAAAVILGLIPGMLLFYAQRYIINSVSLSADKE